MAAVLLGTIILAFSQVVFDRYALVLLPGVALMAGAAADDFGRWSTPRSAALRWAAAALLAGAALAQVAAAERRVQQWVLTHVAPGSRIALHSEFTQYLPRTERQLEDCATFVDTPAAYVHKWSTNGVLVPDATTEPFRGAVLNDERFAAYWCSRERRLRRGGYEIVSYHTGARFQGRLTNDVVREFLAGLRDPSLGFDVLVTSFAVPGAPAATAVVTRRTGQRLIYTRAGSNR
jgi:hypothetical protein